MGRTAESTGDSDAIPHVLDAFRAGEPVLVHDFDDHKGKTDLVYPTGTVGSTNVARACNDVGGLVCVAFSNDVPGPLGLPFMGDALDHPAASSHDLVHDSRLSFSFMVNHRDSLTGITGRDRAMTISRSAPVAEIARAGEYDADDFGGEFRAPGHIHLLRGVPNLLSNRQGHAELGLALADETGISPVVVACEMFDDETGAVLPKDVVHDYADRYGFAFADGGDLIDELIRMTERSPGFTF